MRFVGVSNFPEEGEFACARPYMPVILQHAGFVGTGRDLSLQVWILVLPIDFSEWGISSIAGEENGEAA